MMTTINILLIFLFFGMLGFNVYVSRHFIKSLNEMIQINASIYYQNGEMILDIIDLHIQIESLKKSKQEIQEQYNDIISKLM